MKNKIFCLLTAIVLLAALVSGCVQGIAPMNAGDDDEQTVVFTQGDAAGSEASNETAEISETIEDEMKDAASEQPDETEVPVSGQPGETETPAPEQLAVALSQGEVSALPGGEFIPAEFDVRVGKSDAEMDVVTVDNVKDFVAAIRPNREIRMVPGVYDLSEADTDGLSEYASVLGGQLNITGVENLSILGADDGSTELVTDSRFAYLINFEQCREIIVDKITAGHTPSDYECDAGVFQFRECEKVMVSKCHLYGCGALGIELWSCNGFIGYANRIDDCSLRALSLSGSHNALFIDCQFVDNRAYADVIFAYASDAVFMGCEISGNRQLTWVLIDGMNSVLRFYECSIYNNSALDGYEWPVPMLEAGGVYEFYDCDMYDNTFSD